MNGSAGDDTITGNTGANVLNSGAGNDKEYGGAGNDTVTGNDGSDSLHGEDGDDTFAWESGADLQTGGNGIDLLNYAASPYPISVNQNKAVGVPSREWGDRQRRERRRLRHGSNVENIIGSTSARSVIIGWTNPLDQKSGIDNLFWAPSNVGSYIDGGGGNDTIYGSNGDDILVGGPGNDSVFGGNGIDGLWGRPARRNDQCPAGERAPERRLRQQHPRRWQRRRLAEWRERNVGHHQVRRGERHHHLRPRGHRQLPLPGVRRRLQTAPTD